MSKYDNICRNIIIVEKVIQEMKRVVRPDGYILIHEMINDGQDVRQMVHVDIHHFCANIDRANGIDHNYTYSTDILKDFLQGQGLTIKHDQKYLIQDEQEMKDQYETLDNIYSALKNNISKIENVETRELFRKELDDKFTKYSDIGFALATEYIALVQK